MTKVTYARLDEVLRAMGFTARVADDGARVYEYPASEAIIVLPSLPADDEVRPWHMNMVRRTLEGFGIANSLDLDSRLQKAG